jgi:hypothetical protein
MRLTQHASRWVAVGLAEVILLALSACVEDTPPAQQDLSDEHVEQNIGERLVYVNPDKFPNVVAFCDGPARVYITTRDTQNPVVVMDHPWCPSGER